MKRVTKRVISTIMSAVLLVVAPLVNVTPAAVAASEKKVLYIKEFRVGMGETEAEAKKELEADGYTIMKDDSGKLADLNADAGSKSALKRGANDKIVYLGYKTTDNPREAVTDLAVMNMNGGYSIEDYNALMDQQMDSQIKPFVDRFIATLKEYRANYKKSKSSLNYKRANYIRKMLNQMTDDDTGGQPLGNLLLNETKYEMGDAAYKKLSDEEKKNHADILTILMQANGQATLTMESLLTQAADTSKDTWVDRFLETTQEDLEDRIQEEDSSLSSHKDVLNALDKRYGDAAKELLKKWQYFQENISEYEDKAEDVLDRAEEIEEQMEEIEDIDVSEASDEELEACDDVSEQVFDQAIDTQIVAIGAFLDTREYEGGTLREFFEQDYEEVSSDAGIRKLYPIVDALSDGQIAGLEFLSFPELFQIAISDADTYKQMEGMMKEVQTESIYAGVDRGIYEKGGVALTSDALRAKANGSETEPAGYTPSALTISMWGVTAGFAATTVATKEIGKVLAKAALKAQTTIRQSLAENKDTILKELQWAFDKKKLEEDCFETFKKAIDPKYLDENYYNFPLLKDRMDKYQSSIDSCTEKITNLENEYAKIVDQEKMYVKTDPETGLEIHQNAGSSIADKLAIGFAVITVIMTVTSTIMTFLEAAAYYDTEYIPIPKYMVEKANITAYNEKGEQIMIKNQTAYYKVVPCNRTAGDSKITKKNFETMGDSNDLNGDIGTQWLALYAAKYENGLPILADSLVYRNGDTTIPEGYNTGIHEFGGKAATNLNNKKYLFRDNPPAIKVFFKTEEKTVGQLTGAETTDQKGKATGTGSVFSGGSLAMGSGIGLIVGVFLGVAIMGRRKEKKE